MLSASLSHVAAFAHESAFDGLSMLGAISSEQTFGESLQVLIVGFAVVMVALLLLWGITSFSGMIFRRFSASRAASAAQQRAQDLAEGGVLDAYTDPEERQRLIAVVAAAVHETIRMPHRIVAIQFEEGRSWRLEGRRTIFQSHRVR